MGGWVDGPLCPSVYICPKKMRVCLLTCDFATVLFSIFVSAKRGGVRKFCIINGKGLGKGTKVGDFGFF